MKKGGTIFWSVLLTVVLLGAGAYGITAYRQANCEHVYGEGKVVKEATCEEDGVMEYECDKCWKVKEEKIPATGHTVLQLDAVRATCTSTGLHAGEICEVCEKVLVPQEVIPMLNHDLETVEGKESTCTERGYFEYEACKDCDYTTEIVYMDYAHEYVTVPAQASTCTEVGWNEHYRCTLCGDKKGYVEVAMHDFSSSAPYKCNKCGVNQTWTVTFKMDGVVVDTKEFYYGGTVIYPEVEKEGYVLNNWYYEGTNDYQNQTHAIWKTEDIVLEARFDRVEDRTVTYKVDGMSVGTEIYKNGFMLHAPADPVKEGYIFIGWYFEGRNEKVDFNNSIYNQYGPLVIEARFISAVPEGESVVGNTYRIYQGTDRGVLTITVLKDGEYVDATFSYDGLAPIQYNYVNQYSSEFKANRNLASGCVDVTFEAKEYKIYDISGNYVETITIDETCTVKSTSGLLGRI